MQKSSERKTRETAAVFWAFLFLVPLFFSVSSKYAWDFGLFGPKKGSGFHFFLQGFFGGEMARNPPRGQEHPPIPTTQPV